MPKKYKVTVVLINYNYAQYIDCALRGLEKQNYNDFEVVIVDDASSDNSIEVIKPFLEKNSNFTLIQHELNQGICAANNTGIKNAQGEYIVFSTSDDILMSDFLKTHARVLDEYSDIGISVSDYAYFYSEEPQNIHTVNLLRSKKESNFSSKELVKAVKKHKFWIPTNTSLIRSRCIKDQSFFKKEHSMYNDWYAVFKLAFEYGVHYTPLTLAAMRKHKQAYSVTRKTEERAQAFEAIIDDLNLPQNRFYKNQFRKSHAFYMYGLDFYMLVLNNPKFYKFFKLNMAFRFLCKYLKSKLKLVKIRRKLKANIL